jgi:protein-tyrosine phosphatase
MALQGNPSLNQPRKDTLPMPEVCDWQRAAAPREAIDRVVRALREGQLVALPTETVYGVAARLGDSQAVERLAKSKGRAGDKPMALALARAGDALRWLPALGLAGRRLSQRCWPGPLTLVSGEGIDQGEARTLPGNVHARVCPKGTLGLRVPAHVAILEVLERMNEPLVLTSANRGGEIEAVTGVEVIEALGDDVAVVIDDGPTRFRHASTVVQVEGKNWRVLREGALPRSMLAPRAGCMLVFVCTGNTCRSPLAEALCKKLLAERLSCRPDELPARGYTVLSAGLAAPSGASSASEAVAAAGELGADLTGHSSRQLSGELASQADWLIAMTHNHLELLHELMPPLLGRVRLLGAHGSDIPDPIGCDQEVYRQCARQILDDLERLVPEVLDP